ncbi:MAG: LysE family translocator [Proteobacteria bacterium]|nr:LysE family translocator [Pseudomonadota bacterium]
MLDIRDLAVFAGAAVLLVLTPGPDTLYVASHAAARGPRTGAVAALGIGAGCLVHVLAAALGLSALLVASQSAFAAVKLIGAGYLVWVGVGLLRAPAPAAPPAAATVPATPAMAAGSAGRVFWGAALTNALNPKVALFFLAFLPQFVAPDGQHRAASFVVLGLLFDVAGTVWLLLVAAFTARATRRAGAPGPLARGLGRLTGALFVLLGLRLALARP